MAAAVSLIVIVALGLVVTRVATVAFTLTGMPLEHARFQARSALTGTGFTTTEAESVVDHPVRRRIVMILMLVSGAGALSVLGTLVLSFSGVDSAQGGLRRAAVIVVAMMALVWLSKSRAVDAAFRRVSEPALHRWADFEVEDYAALLHLNGQWHVARVPVRDGDWMASRPVDQLRLPDEGITLMGVEREDGSWVGAPRHGLRLAPGDVVVLYGRESALDAVAARLHDSDAEVASERARAAHAASPPSEPLIRARRRAGRRAPARPPAAPDRRPGESEPGPHP